MKERTDNPHDKRFKELFSNKKTFIGMLRDCVKEPWVYDIDENCLQKTNNSFILQDFTEQESDIVYEAIIKGKKVIFYILLELQSKVDYRMPYRLLLYVVEILRYYYNHSDKNERKAKGFKFPVVFPLVFFSGSDKWTVPLSIREMFSEPERFGKYVLDFDYMLLDAKGYDNSTLKTFTSRLLGVILMLEKSKNDIEFYNTVRHCLDDVKVFDDEEKRIFNLCIKIMDLAYGYNKSDEIKELLAKDRFKEVDVMLCDVIENAKLEKETLIAKGMAEGMAKGMSKGELNKALEVAKSMLLENLSVDFISRITNLSKEQIEGIKLD